LIIFDDMKMRLRSDSSCVGCWQSIKAPCTIIKVTSFLLAKSHVICKIFEAVNQLLRVTNKDWTI